MVTQVLVPFAADAVVAPDANIQTFVSSGTAGELYVYDPDTNLTLNDISASLNAGNLPRAMKWAVKYTDEDGNTALRKSDEVPLSCIRSIRYEAGGAGTAKVMTISGVGNIDCESEYCLKVKFESPEIAKTYGYQDMVKTYSYVTRCCGTACGCPDGAVWDVLMGLSEQLMGDQDSAMNSGTAKTLASALVRNSTTVLTAATYDNDEIWTLTKGSNIINCTTSCQYNSTNVAVGDFIGIMDTGAAGTISAANATYYRVEAVDTTALTITLDRPWHLATYAVAADGSDLQVLPKATGESYADSTWSLVLNGAAQVNPSGGNNVNYTPSYMVDFSVGLSCNLDCNATVSLTTAVVQPEGYGVGIQQMEIAAARANKPYLGATIQDQPKSGYDYFVGTGTSVAAGYHNQIIIDYTDCGHPSAEQPIISAKRLILAIDDSLTTLLGADAGSGDTDDDLLSFFGRLLDVMGMAPMLEQIDLDLTTS